MAHPKTKRAHTLPPTTPLSQRVGGHAGVHVTEDESLLLKPALPREVAFYQFVRDITDASTGLHLLKPWIPEFLGLLSLEGKLADLTAEIVAGIMPVIIPAPGSEGTSTSGNLDSNNGTPPSNMPAQTLVLQNLLYGYRKPCILDVKLGTILYDEDASEEKKARMINKAAETTTLQTGIRLTGFQVYSNHSPDPIVYGKAYGYSLKPEQLQEGIKNFFPCLISSSQTNPDLGTSPPSNSNIGLPADTLLTLLTSLHGSLTDLRKTLSGAHVRIVGGSVLIIYEGDWETATAASGRGGGPGSSEEVESEEDEGAESDQIEVEVDEQGEIIMESSPCETSESSSEASFADLQPRLYTVSLIDFAHTRVVPGEGPDQGVLTGMDTLIRLVDRRKQEVAAFIEVDKSSDRTS
ncbi:SAICAR synthase-like protein [Imleria badia]|nr:SAICAR synthase-like protein [Imleria badia]